MNAGKWLILGIFSVAIVGGVAAWLNHYYRSDEVQARWGTTAINLIGNAPHVEAELLDDRETTRRIDISRANGTLSIRYMLASDFAYEFKESPLDTTSSRWILEFQNATNTVRFGFTPDCTQMREESSGRSAQLVKEAAANLQSFFEEQFAKSLVTTDQRAQR